VAYEDSVAKANNANSAVPPPNPLQAPTLTHGLNFNIPSALAGAGSLALSILNAGYALDLELSALQNEGRGEIISNPRIVTSNQKEALIKQGDQIGYITVTGGNNANVPQVQFKDVVLQLKVTPTITNDGRIFLNMDLQKDDLSGYVNTGVGQVPQIATREVTTAVLVEDGQTVVVGGVYEFKDQNSLSKIPFLGDIPILGNLFKNRNHTKSKAELLVFVTPKVIRVAQRPN
jgi:type IV pilus assembly protein PilQ